MHIQSHRCALRLFALLAALPSLNPTLQASSLFLFKKVTQGICKLPAPKLRLENCEGLCDCLTESELANFEQPVCTFTFMQLEMIKRQLFKRER